MEKRLVTRYAMKSAEAADENQRRVEGVFDELAAAKPDSVSYIVLRLADDSFVHVSFHNHGDDEVNPIASTAAFAHFQDGHADRREGGVDQQTAELVGAYMTSSSELSWTCARRARAHWPFAIQDVTTSTPSVHQRSPGDWHTGSRWKRHSLAVVLRSVARGDRVDLVSGSPLRRRSALAGRARLAASLDDLVAALGHPACGMGPHCVARRG